MKGNSGHLVFSDDNKTITLTNGNDDHYHQVFETADELREFLKRVITLGDEIFGENTAPNVVKITSDMCVGADELYCNWYRCPACKNDVITGNDRYCSICGTKIEFSK